MHLRDVQYVETPATLNCIIHNRSPNRSVQDRIAVIMTSTPPRRKR